MELYPAQGGGVRAYFVVPGEHGGVFELRETKPPEAQGPMVVVKVEAAGLNRGELLALTAFRADNRELKPYQAGIEFAGGIVDVGPDATGWHVGERVMGRFPGAYAENLAVLSSLLYRIPEHLSWAEAAAIPNVFVTAHDALATAAHLRTGERVLITAGSSGVGTAAIQLARFLGASMVVATTRSEAKAAPLRALGADTVLDTTDATWAQQLLDLTEGQGVDVIIDQVGGPMLTDNVEVLAIQGRLVSVGRNGGGRGTVDLDRLALKRAHVIGVTFRTRTPQEAFLATERCFDACLPALRDQRLRPVVDRSFPFDQLGEAQRYMLRDEQIGKIVLTALP
jgi:NADPH:quinone reductase-like Zn-dependent oxidoreductase